MNMTRKSELVRIQRIRDNICKTCAKFGKSCDHCKIQRTFEEEESKIRSQIEKEMVGFENIPSFVCDLPLGKISQTIHWLYLRSEDDFEIACEHFFKNRVFRVGYLSEEYPVWMSFIVDNAGNGISIGSADEHLKQLEDYVERMKEKMEEMKL